MQVKAGNSSKVLAQMTLNATTMSVMLNNLTTGATYSIRVVAYTRVGAGPYSQSVRTAIFISLCAEYHWQLKRGACENASKSRNRVRKMQFGCDDEFRRPKIHFTGNLVKPDASNGLASGIVRRINMNLSFQSERRD